MSIFDSSASLLVSPIDVTGAMGKGLAKEFADRYPRMKDWYKGIYQSDQVVMSKPYFWSGDGVSLCLVHTKWHWSKPSDLRDVSYSILNLARSLEPKRGAFPSVAIPALGCGLGGLDYVHVRALVIGNFYETGVQCELYDPQGKFDISIGGGDGRSR